MKAARFVSASCLLLIVIALLTTGRNTSAQATKALLLFGGEDHKTFLGCLNCIETNSSSVCNEFGKYGSSFQADSIWNEFGKFGSEFSKDSPWNSFSNSAPIIVDIDGKSYGYFSVNSFHHDRTRIDWLVAILEYYDKESELDKTRDKMCGD